MESSSASGRQGDGAPAYAGDVGAAESWEALRSDPLAVLVDVRTRVEWSFVGVPDLSALGKDVVFVEWQSYPAMDANPAFAREVGAAVSGRAAPLYLLCRSGGRSRAAAVALAAAGHEKCFNVAGGFEGPRDALKRRGAVDGWKALGLPWVQA